MGSFGDSLHENVVRVEILYAMVALLSDCYHCV